MIFANNLRYLVVFYCIIKAKDNLRQNRLIISRFHYPVSMCFSG